MKYLEIIKIYYTKVMNIPVLPLTDNIQKYFKPQTVFSA